MQLLIFDHTGGSAKNPEGDLVVRLFDGAIGPTQLAQAQAIASLNSAQRLNFSMDFAPAEPKSGGFARVTGSLPLTPSSNLNVPKKGNGMHPACWLWFPSDT